MKKLEEKKNSVMKMVYLLLFQCPNTSYLKGLIQVTDTL